MNRLIVFAFFLCSSMLLFAQTAVVSAGDSGPKSGAGVSYSIGQVFADVTTDGSHSVHTGIQQSYSIVEVEVSSTLQDNIQVTLYPNPVIENLYIDIKGGDYSEFKAILLDEDGKTLERFSLTSSPHTFGMGSYLSSKVYYLSLYYKGQLYRSYKLIKQD